MRISDWSSDLCSSDLPLSRASFAPTGIGGEHTSCCHTRTHVGEGLLAKTAAHPTCLLADPPLSRASFAPTGIGGDRKSVVSGKSVSVRVEHGGLRILKKTKRRQLH